MKHKNYFLFCGLLPLCATFASYAANPVVASFDGSEYVQNFDGLSQTGGGTKPVRLGNYYDISDELYGSAASLAGWQIATVSSNTFYRPVTDGSSTSSGFYAFAEKGTSDLALGMLSNASLSMKPVAGIVLQNTSGNSIDFLQLSYTLEQWRQAGSGDTYLEFSYKVVSSADEANILGEGYTVVHGLSPHSPQDGSETSFALNGNLEENQDSCWGLLANLSWGGDEYLVLRWEMKGNGQNAVALDNLSITAPSIPEPGTYAMFLSALALGITLCWRRKH